MKKILKLVALVFFSVGLATIYGCKKDGIITTLSISTRSVSIITETTVETGGLVTSGGGSDIIARGVCWSTNNDPKVSDNFTMDGTGSGMFSSKITTLKPSTTYYLRAYVTNSTGTAYGNELTFTTPFAIYPGAGNFVRASFSVGTKVYMGLGLDDGYSEDPSLINKDFWEWDPATYVWSRKTDFPEDLKIFELCFSIGTKGYIGVKDYFSTGASAIELWEYDPATDAWTRKAPLPKTSTIRHNNVSFSIGNKGYIGGYCATDSTLFGIDDYHDYYNDFWEWDQATNIWTRKAVIPDDLVTFVAGFSIGNKGYIWTNTYGGDRDKYSNFWEWNQATEVWTRKAGFGGNHRAGVVGFSIGNKGYIGSGQESGGPYLKDFWEWDQGTDVWTRKADLVGKARHNAVGFSIGNKGYIGSGFVDYKGVKDFWEYDPSIK